MKFKSICLSSMLIYGLYIGTAYPEAVLTSKAYVDNKVPAYNSATESQSLLTDTTTTGTIAKRAIYSDTAANYDSTTQSTQIPTMGAVMSAISSGVSDTLTFGSDETTAANAYSTTFDGTTDNWPAADGLKLVNGTALGTALALKQNIIPAHESTTTDFVITDSTTDGVIAKRAVLGRSFRESTFSSVAGKIARGAAFDGASPMILSPYPVGWGFANQQEAEDSIVTTGMLNAAFGDIWPFISNRQAKLSANDSTTYPDGSIVTYGTLGTPGTVGIATAPTYDANDQLTNGNWVPTMGAVMSAISGGTTALPWATAEQNATGAYNTTFADSGTNVWPTADADKVVKGQTFANAMATKQNKIAGYNSSTQSQSVLTDTTTDGVVGKVQILNSDINDGDALSNWENFEVIPTAGAVYQVAQEKISGHAANAADSLLTDSATDGTVQKRAILDKATFDESDSYWDELAGGPHQNMIPDAGTVGSALLQLSDEKQVKIAGHAANAADSLLTDSTTAGTVQKRAIFTDGTTYVAGTHANQIPTMGAVMSAISGGTTALPWATAERKAANAYNTTFADSGTNVWPTADADKVVKGQTFANALALKQNILPANNGTAYPAGSLVAYGRFDGVPDTRKIVTTVAQSGTDIPTDGAVFSAVAGKANKPTCTLTKPGDSSICYAWTFADVGASCAAYDESVSSASECCSGVTYSYISGKVSYLRCGCASASDCPSGTPNCSANTHQCNAGKI